MDGGFNRWVQHPEAAKGSRQGRYGYTSQQSKRG